MSASLTNWTIGAAAIICTVLVQYGAQSVVLRGLAARVPGAPRTPHLVPVLVVVFVLILGHLVQTLVWALVYLWLGHIATLADAIYFSLASYTTIGTNDIALSIEHRTLGALEAAMGVLMFGWSTALLTAQLIRVRLDDEPR